MEYFPRSLIFLFLQPRPKRSLASRLSGFKTAKKGCNAPALQSDEDQDGSMQTTACALLQKSDSIQNEGEFINSAAELAFDNELMECTYSSVE